MSTRAGLDNGQSHLYLHVGTALGTRTFLGGCVASSIILQISLLRCGWKWAVLIWDWTGA